MVNNSFLTQCFITFFCQQKGGGVIKKRLKKARLLKKKVARKFKFLKNITNDAGQTKLQKHSKIRPYVVEKGKEKQIKVYKNLMMTITVLNNYNNFIQPSPIQ